MPQVCRIVLLAAPFLLSFNTVYLDPCTNNKAINDPYRSTAYRRGNHEVAICDNMLIPGWYRFTSVVGGQMPTTKPEPHFCGTVAPIWMRGTHPTTRGQVLNVTACINYYNRNNGCKYRMIISVKNCGSFYVYKLKPSRGCSIAYCAGNLLPCPKGQIGIVPNCTVSVVMPFPFRLVPTPNITALTHDDLEASLRCNFDFPLWKNVSFYVEWFADGRSISNDTSICENQRPESEAPPCNQRNTEIGTRSGTFRAGHRIRCRLRMKYTTSLQNKWTTLWRDSEFFNVGIEVTPSHILIDVTECDKDTTKTVSFRPTIPVLPEPSSGTDHVSVLIYIPSKFLNQDRQSAVDNCKIKMKGKEIKRIKIKGICDNQDDPANSILEYHFGIEDTHPFWGFYRLPSVRVSVQNTATKECRSVSDPHYTTFDGTGYSIMEPGVYVLFRDTRRNVEIHSRVWLCSWGACNCGLAIREGNDVIEASVCHSLRTFHEPNRLRTLVRSTGPLARGMHIYRQGSGSSATINVILPSGIRIKVLRYGWGVSLTVYAFQENSNSVRIEGLCGNFNGVQGDDFNNGGDKQSHADATSFSRSWRITSRRSYFETLPPIISVPVTGQSCFCPIGKTTHDVEECKDTATYFQLFDNHQGEDITPAMERTAISVRETAYTDDIIEYEERSFFQNSYEVQFAEARIRSKRQIEERGAMSKENATKYCKSAIEDSIGGKTCRHLAGTNLTVFIMECIEDLTITGDTRFVESAFDSMKNGCEEKALRNVSLYKKDSSGKLKPPEEIGSVLCLNDCSNHGNCTNRTCVCEEGFTAADCSMAVNTIPELLGIYDGGLCDIRRRPCKKTDIFGQDFLDSENLTCHAQEFKVMVGNWRPKVYTMKFPGKKVDLFAVKCKLPEPPTKLGDYDHEGTPAGGLLISVSNDGQHPSQKQVRFVSYDSVCIKCNKSSNCSLRDDSCVINGHCLADNQGNPRDWCLKCMPGHSQYRWTPRLDNSPPQFAKNQSTRYAIYGEYLPLQLRATDPDKRPVKYSLIRSTATGYTFTSTGLLKWKANSRTNQQFVFKVTDECNASDTITVTLRIVTCPCQNRGKCSPHPYYPRGSGQYYCTCPQGFTGDRCETNIDDCVGVNCGNGTCVDGVNTYTCRCHVGFAGSLCEQRLTRCSNQACFPGVTCTEIPSGISCGPCPVGFSGNGKTCIALKTTGRPTTTSRPTTAQSTTTDDGMGTGRPTTTTSRPTTAQSTTTNEGIGTGRPTTTTSKPTTAQSTTTYEGMGTGRPTTTTTTSRPTTAQSTTTDEDMGTGRPTTTTARPTTAQSTTTNEEETTATATETPVETSRSPAPTTERVITSEIPEMQVTRAEIRILKKWTEEYGSKTSKAYIDLVEYFESEIQKLFHQAKRSYFKSVTVTSIRPGSILVEFQLTFTKNTADSLLPLKEEIKDGALGSLKVNPNSLKIKEEYSYRDRTPEKENNLMLILVSVLIGLVGIAFLVVVAVIVYRRLNRPPTVNPNQLPYRSNVELDEYEMNTNAYENAEELKNRDTSQHIYASIDERKVVDRCPHAYDNIHFQTYEQEGKNKDFSN